MHIVDRRLNPGGKSLANRQRFLRRAKDLVQRAVHSSVSERDIKDMDQAGEIRIPADGVREPRLSRSPTGGRRDHVLPGNKTYVEGDTIERPDAVGGSGGAGHDGSGEDEFRFVLTRDEFLDVFLDDLELPDLAKRRLVVTETQGIRRAGYTVAGSPANLALMRTMRNALMRRIALHHPKSTELERLEENLRAIEHDDGDPDRIRLLREELDVLRRVSRRVPYIDPLDLRYRRFEPVPKPVAQAVMFCLMDVSGSMNEHMKDIAKHFFILLHIFLFRRYRHVELVFIRHTDTASEVDEETFFHGRQTGGTLVSSALAEMARIVAERYSPANWNIYAAQASDGDNASADPPRVAQMLKGSVLPVCQYFAYIEVGEESDPRAGLDQPETTLWRTYQTLRQSGADIAMRKVHHRRDIYLVFRELFQRRDTQSKAAAQ